MARGHTDWLRRPTYGEAKGVDSAKAVPAGETKTLHTVNGRGVILGGDCHWVGLTELREGEPQIYCDSVLVHKRTAYQMYMHSDFHPLTNPLYIRMYRENSDFMYNVGLQRELMFETKFELKFYNEYASGISVGYTVIYALTPYW